MTKSILILGASSAIAKAAMHACAAQGNDLYLGGRDLEELERIASDIKIRYNVKAKAGFFDAGLCAMHADFLQKAVKEMDGFDGALLAFGLLGEHQEALHDFSKEKAILDCNFVGACSIAHHLANYFAAKRSGFIAGISSVAGDRGRQSNYIYGAAKGGFSLYLQGMRNRLHPYGVKVITIKPGFIDTGMTYGLELPFLASADYAGKKIVRGIIKGKEIIYIPWFWRYIVLAIQLIPEKLFKRTKL